MFVFFVKQITLLTKYIRTAKYIILSKFLRRFVTKNQKKNRITLDID